jgi:succinate dehydrogenase flavin-adding protein (antitoxin of CptAB toxin-antitoxin module)
MLPGVLELDLLLGRWAKDNVPNLSEQDMNDVRNYVSIPCREKLKTKSRPQDNLCFSYNPSLLPSPPQYEILINAESPLILKYLLKQIEVPNYLQTPLLTRLQVHSFEEKKKWEGYGGNIPLTNQIY